MAFSFISGSTVCQIEQEAREDSWRCFPEMNQAVPGAPQLRFPEVYEADKEHKHSCGVFLPSLEDWLVSSVKLVAMLRDGKVLGFV